MKLGHLIALTAALLYTGTIIWSMGKRVPSSHDHFKQLPPTAVTAQMVRYVPEETGFVSITVPTPVEVDATLNGIEIIGDTALLHFFRVMQTDMGYHLNFVVEPQDSAKAEVAKTAVRVRIGLQGGHKPYERAYYNFTNCASVVSKQPFEYANIDISLKNVPQAALLVHAEQVRLDINPVSYNEFYQYRNSARHQISIGGTMHKLNILEANNAYLNAKNARIQDVYGKDIHFSELFFNVPELANIVEGESVQTHFEQTPKYLKLTKHLERQEGLGN